MRTFKLLKCIVWIILTIVVVSFTARMISAPNTVEMVMGFIIWLGWFGGTFLYLETKAKSNNKEKE